MKDQDSKSFWLTIPGIITGVAGFITAIGGLLFTFYQIGWIEKPGQEPKQELKQEVQEAKIDRIYVVGEVHDGSAKAMKGAIIRAINTDTRQEIAKEVTDDDGRFEIKLEFNRNKDRIKLITEKEGYRNYTIILGTEQVTYPSVLLRTKD